MAQPSKMLAVWESLGNEEGFSMSMSEVPAPVALIQMMTGYWIAKSIYIAAELGIADLLQDGPETSEELAVACGAHGASVYRLLRGLASVGIFQEIDGKRFTLTPTAALLQSDVPGSMRALARMYGGEQYQAWGEALHSVQSGQPAFNHVYGSTYFDYFAQNPEAAAIFDDAMTGWTTQVAHAAVAAYDFSSAKTVVDVGGGEGILLATILRANPSSRGILFDLPHVISRASGLLQRTDVGDRCETVAGDFFRSVPAGGDTYLLAQILHDWDDERSRTILENCHRAMRPGGKVLILELVIPPGNEPFFGKWLDLHMLVMVTGRERTAVEYHELLASAGFQLTRVIATESGASIVEATRK